MKRDTLLNPRSMSFFLAGGWAIVASLVLLDYGDNPRDALFLAVTAGGAIIYLIRALLAKP